MKESIIVARLGPGSRQSAHIMMSDDQFNFSSVAPGNAAVGAPLAPVGSGASRNDPVSRFSKDSHRSDASSVNATSVNTTSNSRSLARVNSNTNFSAGRANANAQNQQNPGPPSFGRANSNSVMQKGQGSQNRSAVGSVSSLSKMTPPGVPGMANVSKQPPSERQQPSESYAVTERYAAVEEQAARAVSFPEDSMQANRLVSFEDGAEESQIPARGGAISDTSGPEYRDNSQQNSQAKKSSVSANKSSYKSSFRSIMLPRNWSNDSGASDDNRNHTARSGSGGTNNNSSAYRRSSRPNVFGSLFRGRGASVSAANSTTSGKSIGRKSMFEMLKTAGLNLGSNTNGNTVTTQVINVDEALKRAITPFRVDKTLPCEATCRAYVECQQKMLREVGPDSLRSVTGAVSTVATNRSNSDRHGNNADGHDVNLPFHLTAFDMTHRIDWRFFLWLGLLSYHDIVAWQNPAVFRVWVEEELRKQQRDLAAGVKRHKTEKRKQEIFQDRDMRDRDEDSRSSGRSPKSGSPNSGHNHSPNTGGQTSAVKGSNATIGTVQKQQLATKQQPTSILTNNGSMPSAALESDASQFQPALDAIDRLAADSHAFATEVWPCDFTIRQCLYIAVMLFVSAVVSTILIVPIRQDVGIETREEVWMTDNGEKIREKRQEFWLRYFMGIFEWFTLLPFVPLLMAFNYSNRLRYKGFIWILGVLICIIYATAYFVGEAGAGLMSLTVVALIAPSMVAIGFYLSMQGTDSDEGKGIESQTSGGICMSAPKAGSGSSNSRAGSGSGDRADDDEDHNARGNQERVGSPGSGASNIASNTSSTDSPHLRTQIFSPRMIGRLMNVIMAAFIRFQIAPPMALGIAYMSYLRNLSSTNTANEVRSRLLELVFVILLLLNEWLQIALYERMFADLERQSHVAKKGSKFSGLGAGGRFPGGMTSAVTGAGSTFGGQKSTTRVMSGICRYRAKEELGKHTEYEVFFVKKFLFELLEVVQLCIIGIRYVVVCFLAFEYPNEDERWLVIVVSSFVFNLLDRTGWRQYLFVKPIKDRIWGVDEDEELDELDEEEDSNNRSTAESNNRHCSSPRNRSAASTANAATNASQNRSKRFLSRQSTNNFRAACDDEQVNRELLSRKRVPRTGLKWSHVRAKYYIQYSLYVYAAGVIIGRILQSGSFSLEKSYPSSFWRLQLVSLIFVILEDICCSITESFPNLNRWRYGKHQTYRGTKFDNLWLAAFMPPLGFVMGFFFIFLLPELFTL